MSEVPLYPKEPPEALRCCLPWRGGARSADFNHTDLRYCMHSALIGCWMVCRRKELMEQDAGRGKDGMTKEMGTEYFLERTKVVKPPPP